MQFLQLIEAIASNLTTSNISEFISLTENLISLSESILDHASTNSPSTSTTTPQGS